MQTGSKTLRIPMGVLADSYKASHFLMYPDSTKMVAYGEFRAPYETNKEDHRFVFYGVRYIIENYIAHPWTLEDLAQVELFYKTHNTGFTPFDFPKHLFEKFIKENKGYFPVKIEALPEGTVAHIHTPVYQITAEGEYTLLVTFLETILTQVWYPTCVATLSKMTKDNIEAAFVKSVDDELQWLLESRLHDFGFRGCTCVEQSIIGGCAHLLSFSGSDTMSACYYAQFHLNGGKPVATSIPATEHSVMTSWPSERDAILNVFKKFANAPVVATVMDSYDYKRALDKVVPSVKEDKQKDKLWVLRPDSGDPVEAIMMALEAGDKTFGSTINKKGFKVLNGVATIQGDGINREVTKKILDTVLAAGFSAQNVAFGMGGGLLQKCNRDTMSFATKLSFIRYKDGKERDVMKFPKTDSGKVSLPGILRVKRDPNTGLEVVVPRDPSDSSYDKDDLLRVVYDNGPVENVWDDFATIRTRVQEQWTKAPKQYDPISPQLKAKIKDWIQNEQAFLDKNL